MLSITDNFTSTFLPRDIRNYRNLYLPYPKQKSVGIVCSRRHAANSGWRACQSMTTIAQNMALNA
ncbi:hypothetical protein [Rhodoferax sp.]|uniref:hypothetical protein n=1 Tax=Rhodoferax sp. TaxID=50421 RepID=UPI002757FBEC|nr:hypothetical protein [Rhodoferax sp.]